MWEQGLLRRGWDLKLLRIRDIWEDEDFPETMPWWSAYDLDQGDTGNRTSIRTLKHVKGLKQYEL